jgi:hypothetical protein
LCVQAAGSCQAIHGVARIILQLHQFSTLLSLQESEKERQTLSARHDSACKAKEAQKQLNGTSDTTVQLHQLYTL